ncbi:ChbG/HpnK family deacetylase [Vagococcus sp. DIV0080]|uniref:ChbG/HpnK family deacetylase n=1 Tax=Candidatus Vagococcus giribetii TaxID=2230876 RepID=A0ABS3HQH3_9ENTE|nr:ChbG/HpnK family deacetylase [Vagococcus sp. DIV0080]MBO0475990.1 ChbG/HpnK family deacetylase [Vagococcus sp. DIV0080]
MDNLKKTILFRADDLGYSEAVNYGIEKSVKEGMIQSVGVMVNMPATEHGVRLLKEEPIAFSLHTNICVGKPISPIEKIPTLVDDKGNFRKSSDYRNSEIDSLSKDEVLIEIEAQFKKFIELFGRVPDYFEGHAISNKIFFEALEQFSKEHNLKYSGVPMDADPNSLPTDSSININDNKVYMWMGAMEKDYDPYKFVESVLNNLHDDGVDMIVFHPGYLDHFILNNSSLLVPRVEEVEYLTDKDVQDEMDRLGIVQINYNDL